MLCVLNVESDHSGHDVYSYKANNGCCDCGDPRAWNPAGNCRKHGGSCGNANKLPHDVLSQTREIVGFLVGQIVSYWEEFKRFDDLKYIYEYRTIAYPQNHSYYYVLHSCTTLDV